LSAPSPKILNISWGRIEIEDDKVFKDIKLFPGGCREWNWKETGTQHFPGIQYSDVKELIENGAEEIVLTRGVLGRLRVRKSTIRRLKADGITVHVLKTKKAVKLYNSLTNNRKIGALIHSTC